MELQNLTLVDSVDKMRNHPFMSLQNVLQCKLSGQEFSNSLLQQFFPNLPEWTVYQVEKFSKISPVGNMLDQIQ